MNTLDKQYTDLLKTILEHGIEKEDRTGTGTKSIFGYTVRHNMSEGFPLLTTKKMPWKTIVTELMWFLQGRTDLRYLLENNCHIWTGDAYKVYDKDFDCEHPPFSAPYPPRLTHIEFEEKIMTDDEFNKMYGDLGPIYGKQWRSWGKKNVVNYDLENVKSSDKVKVMELIRNGSDYSKYAVKVTYQNNSIDQIANLINDLKTNPDSRRLMVNAWNVGELDSMTLPPCHYGFQTYTRELSNEEIAFEANKRGLNLKRRLDNATQEMVSKLADSYNIPTRAISLMWNQRSVDTFLGLPFNIASYGLLLEIIATAVNMVPDQLIGNLGDTHLYLDHLEQAQEQIGREMTWEEQIQWVMKNTDVEMENLYITEEVYKDTTPKRTRHPFPLPKLRINTEFWPTESGECGIGPLHQDFETLISNMQIDDFQIEGYQSHPTIKAPLSN
jgi:thymidylate synthase